MTFIDQVFKTAASTEEAYSTWEHFLDAYQQKTKRPFSEALAPKAFFRLFGNSRFLGRFLIKHPESIERLFLSPYLEQIKPFNLFQHELKLYEKQSLSQWLENVLIYKYEEYLRITLKDLQGGQDLEVLSELSSLAYAILIEADKKTCEEINLTGKEFVHHIMALGKMGGWELNYSSDIDLIAIIENEDNKEAFIKQVQLLTKTLQEKNENGFLYRVDWDLRPEGRAGTLVHSLLAYESYYESFGQDWERQALTRAHPAAGDPRLGDEFIKMITPFVYPRYHDLESMQQIQTMKQKIQDQLRSKVEKGFNVKLGRGGIREIEFFLQAFLLIYGGAKKEIRHGNTLALLQSLKQASLINSQDAQTLTKSYRYLRRLENKLQMADEAQTHIIPPDEKSQIKIARRMGYHDNDPLQALESFQKDLSSNTHAVHEIFNSLFADNLPMTVMIPTPAITETPEETLPLHSRYKDQAEHVSDFEGLLDEIRSFRTNELKEIISLEENPKISRQAILEKLSLLAETICQIALELAMNQLIARYGKPLFKGWGDNSELSHLIAIGMGKLGGREINYYSDLDLIFVFSEHGFTKGPQIIENSVFFVKLVQKFISILSIPTSQGIAYAIDTDLRPSGNQGPLVTPLAAFVDYQIEASQIWERQALIKARPLAGSVHLSKLIQGHIQTFLYSTSFPETIKNEMHATRMRVQKEIAKENQEWFDFKLGKGSLMDIEFILQYLQLRHGVDYPALRTPNTFEGLERLLKYDLLQEAQACLVLKEACNFYRTIESKLSLICKRRIHRVNKKDPHLDQVASQMGFASGRALLKNYLLYRFEVREVYRKVFGLKSKRTTL